MRQRAILAFKNTISLLVKYGPGKAREDPDRPTFGPQSSDNPCTGGELAMYPMIYFHSFRQLVAGDEVFVAMPMDDPKFTPIWTEVYVRAIESAGLHPFRVDLPMTGDSILIEILRGLRRARLVLVDISPDTRSGQYPNANVMYELGIAHSMRLPETVIVVRQKGADIPFDVRHIRALDYNVENLGSAVASIRNYLTTALTTGQSLRSELIEAVWSVMDPVCRDTIALRWYVASGQAAQAAKSRGENYDDPHPGLFQYPVGEWRSGRWTDEQLRPAFARLLEFGIVEATEAKWEMVGKNYPPPMYRFTPLGEAVARQFTSVT